MPTSSQALLTKARKLVPPMLEKFHKGKIICKCSPSNLSKYSSWQTHIGTNMANSVVSGQLGRVAVIGGSAEYVVLLISKTFFSSISTSFIEWAGKEGSRI